MSKKKSFTPVSEFRKDPVSGEWILVVAGRKDRPGAETKNHKKRKFPKPEDDPFANPHKNNGGEQPVLWYARPETAASEDLDDWFLQVIPNKYPALKPHHVCPKKDARGCYAVLDGVGFHEVIVTRDPVRTIAEMSIEEVELVLRSYQERYLTIEQEECIQYILVFHNYGPNAGATIAHPHSQLIALPIIPPDVSRSLNGSERYFEEHKKSAYTAMLDFEMNERKRIVYENEKFVVLVPFASQVSFETRIYPKNPQAHFEDITKEDRTFLADALRMAIGKIKGALDDPDYNFFIHTAPAKSDGTEHYRWHIEILPRVAKWAGVELGTGVKVVAVPPEDAAKELRDTDYSPEE